MFELTFLGTSASSPSVQRGLSAHLLLYRNHRFLIDCGEGTQRQILRSGLGFKRLDKILLTHSHLDHILGLGGLVSTLARWETLAQIEVFAGRATLQRVRDLLYRVVMRSARVDTEIKLTVVEPGDTIMEDDHFRLTAFDVTHRGPDCLGFAFEEKARRPFLAAQADALGVPFGPERGRLVAGHSVTLADGRTITPDAVLGPTLPPVRYIHIGDVGVTDNLVEICRDATALTIEATYTERDGEMAQRFGHLTAARAARLARDANVGTLLLTHLSRRYYEREIRQEAQAVFPHCHVARDFDQFQINRKGVQHVTLDQTDEDVPDSSAAEPVEE